VRARGRKPASMSLLDDFRSYRHFAIALALALVSTSITTSKARGQTARADFEGGAQSWLPQTTNSGGTAPAILSGGPTGQYLRMTHLTGGNNNSFMLNENFDGAAASGRGLHIVFDFRMTGNEANETAGGCCGSAADGLGAGIFFTGPGQWPSSGPFNPMDGSLLDPPFGGSIWERPRVPHSLTAGLDIFSNIDEVNLNANLGGAVPDADLANIDVAADLGLDLNNATWHQFQLIVTPDGIASIDIIEDVFGAGIAHTVVAGVDTGLDLDNLPSFRVGVGGRTGGAFTEGDIDNLLAGTGLPRLPSRLPPLELQIDPRDGKARIASVLDEGDVATLHAYEILSDGAPLDHTQWLAENLTAQQRDAINLAQPGQSWQTVNAADDQLFEAYLFGGSAVQSSEAISIGKVLPAGIGETPLTFNYVSTSTFADPDVSSVRRSWNDIPVVYREFDIPGDFNRDRVVDGSDFLAWQRGESPNPGSGSDFAQWEGTFGSVSASVVGVSAVPEPSALPLAFAAMLALGRVGRSRDNAK
jgi:hypothetical protein